MRNHASGGTRTSSREPMSTVAARIVEAASGKDPSPTQLGILAESDPGFAIRVLALVNSPAFGLAQKVMDVRHAVAMLGVRGLRNIALSFVLSDMVPMGPAGESLLANSLRRAVACRMLAERAQQKPLDPHFTAGLLLESGLLTRARDDLDSVMKVAQSPAAHRVVLERAAGVPDHASQGAEIAARFRLPGELVDAIAHHHDGEPPTSVPARIAWVAERLAAVFEGGDFELLRQEARQAGAALRIPAGEVDELLRQMPALVQSAADGMQRSIGVQPDFEELILDASRSLVELNRQYEQLVRQLERVIEEKEALAEQLREANDRLRVLAVTDPLTGLPNKRAFEDALVRDLARADRDGTALCLLVVDLDFFKRINDTHGHATGDDVLRAVSAVLQSTLRAGDLPARLGGEEFGVILPSTEVDGGRIVAERTRAAIDATPIQSGDKVIRVTASIGVAMIHGPGCRTASQELFARADAALYEAKRQGRNRISVALGG